jgi:hypothetical protein
MNDLASVVSGAQLDGIGGRRRAGADVALVGVNGGHRATGLTSGAPTSHQDDVVVLHLESLQVGPPMREGGLSQAHVLVLAELEGRWPPILVAKDDHAVIDGHHRVAAARRLGLRDIRARVFDGGPDEAFVEFVRCNVGHGLPLTLGERKGAVARMLDAHPEWSDRRLARLCALSPTTVGRIRSERGRDAAGEPRPSVQVGHSAARVGQDGRLRSAEAGGKRAHVAELLNADPDRSLRAVAHAVGVSAETVRSVRNRLQAHDKGQPTPWQGDAAFSSVDGGAGFVEWFDRTLVEEVDCWSHVGEIPLSRLYVVADEARRRARCWSAFATALEQRVKQTGA